MRQQIDPKQYCTQLVNAPRKDEVYRASGRFYICSITSKECIAKRIIRHSDGGRPIEKCYSSISINEELLQRCPAHNPSDELSELLKSSSRNHGGRK